MPGWGCTVKPRYIRSCQLLPSWGKESREIVKEKGQYIFLLSVNWDLQGKSFGGCPMVTTHLNETRLSESGYRLLQHSSHESVHCSHSTQLTRAPSNQERHAWSPLIRCFLALSMCLFSGVLNSQFSILILFFRLDTSPVSAGITLFLLYTNPDNPWL